MGSEYGARLDDTRGQADPGMTGCAYADGKLLPAIRLFGQMDQEMTGAEGAETSRA